MLKLAPMGGEGEGERGCLTYPRRDRRRGLVGSVPPRGGVVWYAGASHGQGA